MSIYLDAAVLVAFWTENDAHSARVLEFFESNVEALSISGLVDKIWRLIPSTS